MENWTHYDLMVFFALFGLVAFIIFQVRKIRNTSYNSIAGMLHKFLIYDNEGPDKERNEKERVKDAGFVMNAITVIIIYGIILGAIFGGMFVYLVTIFEF